MSVVLSGVSKIYGKQKAVDNISFTVGKGEILGFLGPNGAGKSTTMKMITGYLKQDAGTIEVMGLPVSHHETESKKHIGYLSESNPLYKEMYVREYLQFNAQIHQISKPKSRIDYLLESTGLIKEANKIIGTLSKGYQQRVGLAQALLHNPEILILDEPTSGLDPNQLADIRMLIKNLGKEKTIVFSTHIMQEVSAVCDSVIIISQGEIVKKSTIENLHDDNNNIRIKVSFENGIDTNKLKSYNIEIVEASADTKTIEIITKDPLQTKKTIFYIVIVAQYFNQLLTNLST